MFIKICGITNEEDALLAVALGADCIGFNFVAGSVRQISPNDAEAIRRRLPHGTVTVGVFKNESPEKIVSTVSACGLSGAQLHGREPVSEVRWIRKRLPFVIQAFAADDPHLASAGNSPADIILLDAATPGSGRIFDWRLANNAPGGIRLMIAGGLNPDNVAEAITQIKPYGVDVATGVEQSPGKKSATKMQKFIDIARTAAGETSPRDTSTSEQSAASEETTGSERERGTRSRSYEEVSSAIYDWRDDGE
jgi:phosphoribosylanthranilate isomerase